MSDDDPDWADALAGRPREGAAPATLAEAALLRDAMRRWPVETPALEPRPVAELIERARREGVLAPRRAWCAGCLERWRRWTANPLGMGAAGLVLASLLGLWIVPGLIGRQAPIDGPGTLRAPSAALQLRAAADPQAARDNLAARLQALQVPVRRYERLGRFGLDADLPRPLSPALAALLHDEVLPAGDDGSLRVEFEAAKVRP
ncbi:MAG: hypothetical protein WC760_13715 [Bacteroidia bacterium]|jgi:hypothetical protein